MNIFYAPDIAGNQYMLNEDESKHCIRVLRMQASEKLILIDGRGGYYRASIADAHPKRCLLVVDETILEYEKPNYKLHIAIAPTKNLDRLEWFAEKATEIGISEITPIICDHSERKVVNTERLEKIVIAAIKQSVKAYKPKINEAISFNSFIKTPKEGFRFLAHCEEADKKYIQQLYKPSSDALILIGPEGDFSTTEINDAIKAGFLPISLGKSRLRTETAGVFSCSLINILND